MPTVISHALVAGTLADASRLEVPRARLILVAAVLAMLPDADVIAFPLGIPYAHPLGHRGLTHSLPFAAFAGLAATALLFPRTKRFSATWWRLAALLTLATASHGLLDAFTDAGRGVGFFIPFDNARYFAPWRPLRTSPVTITGFLQGPAVQILTNEARFIWLPLVTLSALFRAFRRRGERRARARRE